MTEFARRLKNNVKISGELVSITNPKEGVTQAGIPFVSCRGEIACSADGSQTFGFKVFSKKITSSGAESKAFPKLRAGIMGGWVTREMAAQNTGLEPTKIELHGGLNQNMYVNQEGKLIATEEIGVTFASDFKDFAAEIDIEAFVKDVTEEVFNDNPTGRYVYTLVARDGFGNTIMPRAYTEGETYRAFENAGICEGETTTIYLDLVKRGVEKSVSAIGRSHSAGTFLRKEYALVGALPPYTDDKALEQGVVNTMVKEFEAKKRDVEAEGYKGNGGRGQMIGAARPAVNIPQPVDNSVPQMMVDVDDIPF